MLYQKRFRRERKIRIRYQQQLGEDSSKGSAGANASNVSCSEAELGAGSGAADGKCSNVGSDGAEAPKGKC